mgnify:FL=1
MTVTWRTGPTNSRPCRFRQSWFETLAPTSPVTGWYSTCCSPVPTLGSSDSAARQHHRRPRVCPARDRPTDTHTANDDRGLHPVARGHAPEAPAVIIVLIEKAHQRSARARGRQDRGRRHTQGGPPLTISFRPLLPFFDARIPTRTFDATCDATDPPRAAHVSVPPAGETRGGSRPSSFEKHAFCSHSRPLTAILPLSLLSINRSHGSRMTSRSIRVSSSPSARSNS